jgi:hypothetical protein
LLLHTDVGDVRLTPPVAYQEIAGTRRMLPAAYAISGDEYGFRVRGYDPTLPVVIDPLLQATYFGGSDIDEAFAVAIEPTTGDVYVAGDTFSFDFPGTATGAQRRFGGASDAFVVRLNPDLTGLKWATFLGGSGFDSARALAIAPRTGEVFIAGNTTSDDFPGASGGAQSVLDPTGSADAFVARLSADLTMLEQATYLGGTDNDTVLAMQATTSDVYVAGATLSSDFPGTGGGAQSTGGGNIDGFVARLPGSLTAILEATYLGGSGDDLASGLAIAPMTGDVYVAGKTTSVNLPGTRAGAQSALRGPQDSFVARLSPGLVAIEQATYLGGTREDEAEALAIAPMTGDVYVAGTTRSNDFPATSGGAQSVLDGSDDAFVARLNSELTALDQATYLGGGNSDIVLAIQATMWDVYVAGFTFSLDFPATGGGAQNTRGGDADGFVARLDPDLTVLNQATYLGGRNVDVAFALAIAPTTGDVYVAGFTASTDFPGTADGAQSAFGGGQDAIVARLSGDLSSTPTTTTPTSTSSSTTTSRPTTTTSTINSTTTSPSTTTTSSSTTTTIPAGICPVGPGFWKKHPSVWPVTTLVLGSQTYTQSELLAVLRARRSGADASLLLARQLIAAKLNVANGSDPTTIGTTVADADRLLAMFGGRLPYGVPRSSALGASMIGDRDALDHYNAGRDTPTCVRDRERG